VYQRFVLLLLPVAAVAVELEVEVDFSNPMVETVVAAVRAAVDLSSLMSMRSLPVTMF
jgi:hypothetical protein